jgi:CRP/FNR family transcriptional regulator, cyclic AMP receptor protein
MDKAFETFSECVLFRRLERREIEALFARVRIRDFVAGETIFVTGSPADSLMIVLRGAVQTRVAAPEDRPILLPDASPKSPPLGRRVSPTEMLGEIALLDGGARLGDAIALTDCSLAIVDRQDMLSFLEQNPVAWQDIGSVLRGRLALMPAGWQGRQQYADLTRIALLHEQRYA